jgi:hypothetical protein
MNAVLKRDPIYQEFEMLHARFDDLAHRLGQLEELASDGHLNGLAHAHAMTAAAEMPGAGAVALALYDAAAKLAAVAEQLGRPKTRTCTINLPSGGTARMTVQERSSAAWEPS